MADHPFDVEVSQQRGHAESDDISVSSPRVDGVGIAQSPDTPAAAGPGHGSHMRSSSRPEY